ncbi:hypothetical protein TGMAS_417110, partial [Toxoplasma gondii MAS]
YRDFVDAAAAADDSTFASFSELPGLVSSASLASAFGKATLGSEVLSGPRGASVAGAPDSSLLFFGEEVLPFLPSPAAKNELVCEVLSPHPSYKLLMVTSTVKVFNYSGLPLQICFLDSQLNPLLLPCAEARKARTETIYGASCAAPEGGSASSLSPRQTSFHQISCSHPELRVVPPWLQEKETWIEKQMARDVQAQIENVFLLDADATLATASPAPAFHSSTDTCSRGRDEDAVASRGRDEDAVASRGRDDDAVASRGRDDDAVASRGRDDRKAETCAERGAEQGDDPRETRDLHRATYAYTFLLEDKHFMSVPQPAILGAGWCYLCFRPAAFAQKGEEDSNPRREQDGGLGTTNEVRHGGLSDRSRSSFQLSDSLETLA